MVRGRSAPVVVGWLTIAVLGVLGAARIARLDEHNALVFAAHAITPLLYLPAYAVLAVALVLRRRALAGAALTLVLLHGAWLWQDLPWAGDEQPVARGARVVVLAVNARGSNPVPGELAAAVRATRADVVVVTELTPPVLAALRDSGELDRLPNGVADPRPDFFGSAVFTHHDVERAGAIDLGGRPTTEAIVDVGGVSVRVVAVHTIQPFADFDGLRRGLFALRRLAVENRGHLVLAGDFNATSQHRVFRRLLSDTRLRDAHRAVGRGLARTWPAGRAVPPLALIDHVLVSRDIAVLSVDEITVPGSDHRAVRAVLRLPAGAPG